MILEIYPFQMNNHFKAQNSQLPEFSHSFQNYKNVVNVLKVSGNIFLRKCEVSLVHIIPSSSEQRTCGATVGAPTLPSDSEIK